MEFLQVGGGSVDDHGVAILYLVPVLDPLGHLLGDLGLLLQGQGHQLLAHGALIAPAGTHLH